MRRVGDISQLAGARQFVFTDGSARGMRGIDIDNGSGLRFTLLPDRGLDIAWNQFRGTPLGYISKSGIKASNGRQNSVRGFLEYFYAGFLTTCGYTNMGNGGMDGDEEIPMHGAASQLAAADVSVYQEWEGDDYVIRVRGKIRECTMGGPNMVMTREFSTRMGSNIIHLKDTLENLGFESQPMMILYHHNLGYPIVSEESILYHSEAAIEPRTDIAKSGLSDYAGMQSPTPAYQEQVFYHHDFKRDDVFACLYNPTLELGSYVRFSASQLPYLTQWKQMGEGDYALGLEPGTWKCDGRPLARERGELARLKPGERQVFELDFG
ncbi:MAG: aldose 1-epimerase family protein, partial [Clostridium sp.]|nr:aldose 1-epimerase family protein [Clostridium sp.]